MKKYQRESLEVSKRMDEIKKIWKKRRVDADTVTAQPEWNEYRMLEDRLFYNLVERRGTGFGASLAE